ncbi:cytochrome c oxidase assembly protein [uncultured Friedmanniella sp.]|uniref:cytochrome c oxidase assembly protein n=1 Tax=uncultured Friedmanniella sp. TaxID=335381 RepID=UPI0035CB63FC
MPPWATFFDTWRVDPVAAGVVAVTLVGWLLAVLRLRRSGTGWPVRASLGLLVALGGYAAISFGFLGVESRDLRWAFTTRIALLLLVVPSLALLGRPLELATRALPPGPSAALGRIIGSWPARLLGNALVAPVVACAVFVVFLTPVGGAWRTSGVAEGTSDVLAPLVGLLFVIGIAAHGDLRSDVFLAAEFGFSFLELVLDAIPGLVLRLTDHVLDGVGAVVGPRPVWWPSPLSDQHWSGDFLWVIAEVSDVPILIALFVRWARTDARRARVADELSEAEHEDLVRAHLRRDL